MKDKINYLILGLLIVTLVSNCLTCTTVKTVVRQVDEVKEITSQNTTNIREIITSDVDDLLQEHFMLEEMSDKNNIPIKSMYLDRSKFLKDDK